MSPSSMSFVRNVVFSGTLVFIGFGFSIASHLEISPEWLELLQPAIGMLGIAIGSFSLAWLTGFLVSILLRRAPARRGRPPKLLSDLISACLFALALFTTIGVSFGQSGASIIASSGLIIAVLGFAVRSVVADTLSGIALGLEAPFRIGDWIAINDEVSGRVIEIGWRTTRLLTRDSTNIILPNSQIARQRLTNFSAPLWRYRTQIEVHVDHTIDSKEVCAILTENVLLAGGILKQPAPEVFLSGIDQFGLRMHISFWVPSFLEDRKCRDQVLTHVLYAMQKHNLFPKQPRFTQDGAVLSTAS